MAKKKRISRSKAKTINSSGGNKLNMTWGRFILFTLLFLLSLILYSLSSNSLLENFFGIASIILGVLAFTFLVSFIVLSVAKRN